jgi:hypothetical protein
MVLADWKEFLLNSFPEEDYGQFKEKDIFLMYNMALQTQISELESDRHLEMNFLEFLEGFARVAEFISPIPFFQFNQEQLLNMSDFR